jgi:phosphomevalonate kinase
MLHTMWAIVTLVSLIGTYYVLKVLYRFLVDRYTYGGFILFCLVVVFIFKGFGNENLPRTVVDELLFNTSNKVNYKMHQILLDKNEFNTLELNLVINPKSENTYILRGNSVLLGFSIGTEWNQNTLAFNEDSKNRILKYKVIGVYKWKLLGYTIYKEPKNYMGEIALN